MRTIITVFIRSEKPVIVSKGVYDYAYTKLENVPAEVKSNMSNIMLDGSSTEKQDVFNVQLSFVISNDSSNRVSRISYVKMNNTLYDIGFNNYYYPKVISRLGNQSKVKEEQLKLVK